MNTPSIELMSRDGRSVASLTPATIDLPGPIRLREALSMEDTATDAEVMDELRALDRRSACDSCRHTDADSRGHFACGPYHPAWDVAEELGLADAYLVSMPSQYLWVLSDERLDDL